MNKNELIGAVADASGLTRGDATKAVEGVFDTISAALKKGDEVLARALTAPIQAIEWTEADDLASQPGPVHPASEAPRTAH